jgi:hypothetical protein
MNHSFKVIRSINNTIDTRYVSKIDEKLKASVGYLHTLIYNVFGTHPIKPKPTHFKLEVGN